MSEVTKPMVLDETLQDVADALDNLTEGYAGESAYEAAASGGYTMPQSQFEADTQAVRWRSNPNLLDNWYFVGGGDQQGEGQFPINQRKQTSYTTAYAIASIDRYRISNSLVTINSNAVNLKMGNGGSIRQRFAHRLEWLPPGTYTMAALIDIKSLASGTRLNLSFSNNQSVVHSAYTSLTGKRLLSTTFTNDTLRVGTADIELLTNATSSAQNCEVDIYAMKLELGSEQTLAHLENGVWALNEIPDYGKQLLRCQRFFRVFTSTSTSTTGYGYSTNPKNLRPEMRATPSTGSFTYGGTTYYYLDANL